LFEGKELILIQTRKVGPDLGEIRTLLGEISVRLGHPRKLDIPVDQSLGIVSLLATHFLDLSADTSRRMALQAQTVEIGVLSLMAAWIAGIDRVSWPLLASA
jgi:hypothetical protein